MDKNTKAITPVVGDTKAKVIFEYNNETKNWYPFIQYPSGD